MIGNRINGQWTSSSYDTIVKELREKLDLPIKKDHLQNRQKTLKKNFNDAYEMFRTQVALVGMKKVSVLWLNRKYGKP